MCPERSHEVTQDMTIAIKLADYIKNNFALVDEETIGIDDPLIEEGIIDSLGIVQLLDYISQEFGVEIDADELLPENFSSIRAIETLIDRKRA